MDGSYKTIKDPVTGKEVYLHRYMYFNAHPDTPRQWHIHHIDHVKYNNNLYNLIALPENIHHAVHEAATRKGRHLFRDEIMKLWERINNTKKYKKKKKKKNKSKRVHNWLKRHN